MDKKVKISLTMIVKNEQQKLPRCLESVKNLVDEMVIVDTGSTDNTVEIAKKFGANVYYFNWNDDFSAARNFALEQAKGEWCLVLDADEYVIEGTREEIERNLENDKTGIITIINSFKKSGEVQYNRCFIARLLSKEARYTGKIHEQVVADQYVKIPLVVEHDGYMYQDKSERNLEILLDSCKKAPKDAYMQYQLAHTLYLSGKSKEAISHYEIFYKECQKNLSYRASAIIDYIYCLIDTKNFKEAVHIIESEKARYDRYPDFHLVSASLYRELVLSNIKENINYLPRIEEEYLRCLDIGETTEYDSIEGAGSYIAAYNLGVWYEVTKQLEKAVTCYQIASECGYAKAEERLKEMQISDY